MPNIAHINNCYYCLDCHMHVATVDVKTHECAEMKWLPIPSLPAPLPTPLTEIETLRAALRTYADPDAWNGDSGGPFDMWLGEGNGWDVARAALKQETH